MKIIVEVDADQIDWTGCTCFNVTDPDGPILFDIDHSEARLDGKPVQFLDDDEAADYLIELWRDTH